MQLNATRREHILSLVRLPIPPLSHALLQLLTTAIPFRRLAVTNLATSSSDDTSPRLPEHARAARSKHRQLYCTVSHQLRDPGNVGTRHNQRDANVMPVALPGQVFTRPVQQIKRCSPSRIRQFPGWGVEVHVTRG